MVSYGYIRVNVCDKPFPILKTHLSGVITVSEEEVIAAMRIVSSMKILGGRVGRANSPEY